ncbi:MAG: short-chain dehydrogenase [Gemmatimonadetes bacterium]|nr:short-chain dehydrogenase [Gemmatimonadota bacterium]
MSRFTEKTAIVTGSTQGLGETAARLFAEEGMRRIVLTGRNEERGQTVAASLTEIGCEARFVPADLADPEACRSIVAQARDHVDSVDILVNSAGLTSRGTIYDTSLELWDQLMAVNLRAPFLLMQESINWMRETDTAGSIVNIISSSAYGGQPFLTPYSTSKGGLATLTKNVAYAVARRHIRVNGLMLGWMDTPGEDVIQRQVHTDGDDWIEEAEATRPFGRLIKMDEAARAIAYLASDDSGLMTGALIDFDQSIIGGGDAPIPLDGEFGIE